MVLKSIVVRDTKDVETDQRPRLQSIVIHNTKNAETDQMHRPKRADAPRYVPPHRRTIAENAYIPSNPPRIGKRHHPSNPPRIGKRQKSGQKLSFAEEPVYYNNNNRRPRRRNQPSQWIPINTRHGTVPLEQGRFNAWHRSNYRNRFSHNFQSTREHTDQGTNKSPFLDLPLDIIWIILLKCPPKSILRFRCVSKGCYQITKDPNFLDFHLENALSKPPSYILTKTSHYYWIGHAMEALYLVEEGKEKWRATEIGVGGQIEGKVQIVGSCRGLLCLCREDLLSEEAIFIYNPITREYLALPQINDKNFNVGRDLWGEFDGSISFGFDENSKKYKVVFISTSNKDAKGYIISLGETSWRRLQNLSSKFEFSKYMRQSRTSLFSNGCFYWIISKNDESGNVKRILVMDICQEKFAEIKFIDNWDEEDVHYLVNFGKLLALIAYDSGNADMKIWVLEDCNRGIWNRHSNHNMLSFHEHKQCISREGYDCRIEGTIGEETLLLEYFDDHMSDYYHVFGRDARHYLVAYTPRSKQFRFDFVPNHSIPSHFDIVSFVPSFVSLAF